MDVSSNEEKQKFFQTILDQSVIEHDKRLFYDLKNLISKRQLTIAVAETITKGLLNTSIATLINDENTYLGGITAPKIQTKLNFFGVTAETVRNHGPESSQVSLEISKAIHRIYNSSLSVAVTGQLVYKKQIVTGCNLHICFLHTDTPRLKTFNLEGGTEQLLKKSITTTLGYLKQYLSSLPSYIV